MSSFISDGGDQSPPSEMKTLCCILSLQDFCYELCNFHLGTKQRSCCILALRDFFNLCASTEMQSSTSLEAHSFRTSIVRELNRLSNSR